NANIGPTIADFKAELQKLEDRLAKSRTDMAAAQGALDRIAESNGLHDRLLGAMDELDPQGDLRFENGLRRIGNVKKSIADVKPVIEEERARRLADAKKLV